MNYRYLTLLLILLFPLFLKAQILKEDSPKKKYGWTYIAVSGGIGIWSQSEHPGMTNDPFPYTVMIEAGKTMMPFHLIIGADFLGTYTIDHFILNPNHFSLAIGYAPLRLIPELEKIDFYVLAGGNVCYTRFTEEKYSGIVTYTHKEDVNYNLGLTLGIGAGYRFKNFELTPSLMYYTGKTEFLAGHFDKQVFYTGSLNINIMLKYYFVFNTNKNTCPAYKEFYRFE